MAYSSYFGKAAFIYQNQKVIVPDMTKGVNIPDIYLNDPRYILPYRLADGDRIDSLAQRIYDDPGLFWVIMSVNKWYDLSTAFPLEDDVLDEFISEKYPYNKPSDVHHYRDDMGHIIDVYALMVKQGLASIPETLNKNNLTTISIFNYEYMVNEQKRNIKILDPELISSIKKQLRSSF